MPFPNPPHPELRQWDDCAGGAATVAQLLHMGGELQYPFDTTAFDRCIKRQPEKPVFGAEGLRLLARLLPVTIFRFSPVVTRDFLDPKVVRASLQKMDYSDDAITEYLEGPDFALNKRIIQDFMRVEHELGDRYRQNICRDSSRYVGACLRHGAVVSAKRRAPVTAMGDSVLLIPQEAGKALMLYDPWYGLKETSLERVVEDCMLELDEDGFTAYEMA